MRILANIFSIAAFVLSSLLTIQLLTSRAEGPLAILIMAMMGLIAEGGKGLLFYHGVRAKKSKKNLSAASSLVVAGFLIFLSILGTVAALNLSENKSRDSAIEKTFEGQQAMRMRARAKELREEAASLDAIYVAGKIRRGNEAWELEQKAQQLLASQYSAPADYFDRIASFLHITPLQAQTLIFWGYGFALELIACLLAVIGIDKPNIIARIPLQKTPPTPVSVPKKPTPEINVPQPPADLKEALKTYIKEMDGPRFMGFAKLDMTRAEWNKCGKFLYDKGLLRKNTANYLEATVAPEILKRWIGV